MVKKIVYLSPVPTDENDPNALATRAQIEHAVTTLASVVPIAEGIDHKLFHEQLVVDLLAKELTFNELLAVCYEVRSTCTAMGVKALWTHIGCSNSAGLLVPAQLPSDGRV
jgi:hypothetical protein